MKIRFTIARILWTPIRWFLAPVRNHMVDLNNLLLQGRIQELENVIMIKDSENHDLMRTLSSLQLVPRPHTTLKAAIEDARTSVL